jgi:L-threonylcarbamoyladenylate synthase
MEILRVGDVGVEVAAAKAALVLKSDGLVVYPTDTLYGLGAAMDSSEAVAKLHAIKSRSEEKFLSFIVPDVSMIERYAHMNETSRTLATSFLPGPLTLKLEAKDSVPASVAHDGAIRIRIPDDTFALALARAYGAPFSATSANISGEPTPSTIEGIVAQFGERISDIDLLVDDGPRAGGTPSTIISCVGEKLEIIREGALSKEALGL